MSSKYDADDNNCWLHPYRIMSKIPMGYRLWFQHDPSFKPDIVIDNEAITQI